MSKAPKAESVDLVSDAWERFERGVDTAVKGGPQHKAAASLSQRLDAFVDEMREFTARLESRPSLQPQTPD